MPSVRIAASTHAKADELVPQPILNGATRHLNHCSSASKFDVYENGLSPTSSIKYRKKEDEENLRASTLVFCNESFSEGRSGASICSGPIKGSGVVRRTVVATHGTGGNVQGYTPSEDLQGPGIGVHTLQSTGVVRRTIVAGSCTSEEYSTSYSPPRKSSLHTHAQLSALLPGSPTASEAPNWTWSTAESTSPQKLNQVSQLSGGASNTCVQEDTRLLSGGCATCIPLSANTPPDPQVVKRVLPNPQLVTQQMSGCKPASSVSIFTRPDGASPTRAPETTTFCVQEPAHHQAVQGQHHEQFTVVRTFSRPAEDAKPGSPRKSSLNGDVNVRFTVAAQPSDRWVNVGSSIAASACAQGADSEQLLRHGVEEGTCHMHDRIRHRPVVDSCQMQDARDSMDEPRVTLLQEPTESPSELCGAATIKENVGIPRDSAPQRDDDSCIFAKPTSATYSCPYCGAGGLPSFDAARGHCRARSPARTTPDVHNSSMTPPQARRLLQNRTHVSNAGNLVASNSAAGADCDSTTSVAEDGAKVLWVRELVRFRCPVCGDLLPSQEEAAQHCIRTQTVMYRCPICSDMLPSREEARVHCAGEAASVSISCTGENTSLPQAGASLLTSAAVGPPEGLPPLPPGETIAYNAWGQPMIVRQVDSEKGLERTIVQNDDGTIQAFGENTVQSLVKSTEDDTQKWVSNLTDRQLRGLVHEFGQRLLSTSRTYQSHQEALQNASQRQSYAYFGLDETASDKDLDKAYRQMSKKMHPDKNGGTEEAKRKFQYMKERYESLKAKRMEVGPGPQAPATEPEDKKAKENDEGDVSDKEDTEQGDEDAAKEDHNSEDQSEEANGTDGEKGEKRKTKKKRKEAYDEDDEMPKKEKESDSKKIEYDPNDRDSLQETVMKMARQYKVMEQGLSQIQHELRKAWGCPP